MIWLNPKDVLLGSVGLSDVRSVTVDERAEKLLVEFSDAGPHANFVDVPERRFVIKVRRRVLGNENLGLAIGEESSFVMRTAPTGSDGPGVTVTATVVLTSLTHKVDRHDGAEQVIEAVALSADGSTPPVTVSSDGGA
jgi:hypothetical protein